MLCQWVENVSHNCTGNSQDSQKLNTEEFRALRKCNAKISTVLPWRPLKMIWTLFLLFGKMLATTIITPAPKTFVPKFLVSWRTYTKPTSASAEKHALKHSTVNKNKCRNDQEPALPIVSQNTDDTRPALENE